MDLVEKMILVKMKAKEIWSLYLEDLKDLCKITNVIFKNNQYLLDNQGKIEIHSLKTIPIVLFIIKFDKSNFLILIKLI